ncbi:hypothetical protein RB653_001246 [Dictyostelium firmibasis]|uniref:K Homology domain-containing protein n=1 Tax=Dictyostelium firmibasis TaxID=79012 RepID=A0AAN7U4R9_9MYCE
MNNRGGFSHPPGKFHMRGSKTYTPRNGGHQQQQQPQQAAPAFDQQQQNFDQQQQQQQPQQGQQGQQGGSNYYFQSKFGNKPHRGGYHGNGNNNNNNNSNNNNNNSNSNNNNTSPNLNSTSHNTNNTHFTNSRGGHRGGSRGGSSRGGNSGSSRGGRGGYRSQSSFYNSSYQKSGPRLLTSIVQLPPFSGGAIIGVKGSLWGLLNKATTARLKVFKNTAIIKCADAQQLDRAKEIVLKLKNTSPKYLSLIDYKGEQKIKFVHQPSFSEVVLESGAIDPLATDGVQLMQDLINSHESQYVARLNETFSTLYTEKGSSTPFIDIEAGKIWYLHSSNIPSTPMTADKYELYTESLASVFQPSNVINEQFITSSQYKLFKQKKQFTFISVLDTESLDLLCIKCSEEKINNTNQQQSPNSDSSEYKFTDPFIYKLNHINSSKVLFPQIKSGSDLRVTIDTHSKSKLVSGTGQHQYDNLIKFIDSIKIHKNSSGNNTYQIPDSNLFMTESIITRKVLMYRSDDNTLQFHVNQDIATRYTTSNPEVNRESTTVFCTSPALYDLFKSKNWTVDQASDELKKLSKNLRLLVSKHLDSTKFQPPSADHTQFEQDDDEEEN